VLAEVDLVQIGFEDLRLGIPPFDQDRQPGFLQLAQDRPLARQQSVLDELLRDGASALYSAAPAKIGPGCPHD
jgi:hypothetical protein